MRQSLRDGFRGCMIGGVIGDAMGSPVECKYWNGISDDRVRIEFGEEDSSPNSQINKRPKMVQGEVKPYTDDTAMARVLGETLLESGKSLPSPRTLATAFYNGYFKEPNRGYGLGVVSVFKALRESKAEFPFAPAEKQFEGSGSYGNGAAMRIHPLALYAHEVLNDSQMLSAVKDASRVTHAHHEGINGALIQSMAVRIALRGEDNLLNILLGLSGDMTEEGSGENDETFASQMQLLQHKLLHPEEDPLDLGNDVSALKSVPSAIYSFLRVREGPSSPFSEVSSPFQRTLMTAVGFGGDTDTIASMAGAIAGAWYGESGIPGALMEQCEWAQGARAMGDALYELYEDRINKVEDEQLKDN
eukprot:TRINITY_DN22224_c0_g1_i1.p1 TRINITY_DN22224_c0_g1~~TRINITY_DN22224_c0_g1_i1.p1  ORF type:complete len:360 (+),score=74.38 TRINITY_DN22224_c0_g1_i1:35-1114(+)